MASSPHLSTNFADLLDPRFQEIFHNYLPTVPSMIPVAFDEITQNDRDTYRVSSVGTLPDWAAFSGSVGYVAASQGYDTVLTYLEFTSGTEVERKLFDDDQFGIIMEKPKTLAESYARTREGHGARVFVNAFTNDTFFYVNSEAVALCSNSHTTTSGASTATGFDNLGTAPLSATAVAAARIQMRNFRGDQAEKIQIVPDELWIPIDRFEEAYEIVGAAGKVDTALNNPNVHKGKYTVNEWLYMTDANDWFMSDSRLRKRFLKWVQRIPVEFAMAEDIDTLIAKWRGYARYGWLNGDWRWVMGHQVS